MATNTQNSNQIWSALALVLVLVVGYYLLTTPDNRSFGQRLSDTFHHMNSGESLDKASEQLEKRTPGQKLGDAIKDSTAPHK